LEPTNLSVGSFILQERLFDEMARQGTNVNRNNRSAANPEENKNELDTTNETPAPESEVPTNEAPEASQDANRETR